MEATMKDTKWVRRWKSLIARKPVKPGVWRRKEGGYLVRGRVTDRTGKLKEVRLTLPNVDAATAYALLHEELDRVRQGASNETRRMRFAEYAASLMERKVREGRLNSAKSRERWASALELHLLPFFGEMWVDELRRGDIQRWKDEYAAPKLHDEGYSPNTVNGWLAVLKTIANAAVGDLELDRNPVAGIEPFDTSTYCVYPEEEPNSLTIDELPAFLHEMRESFSQHFAMVLLGFVTGLRPSSMRPLRRAGPTPDILWEEGCLLVRQSHTRRQEVMKKTKTASRQRIVLPDGLIEILRWHVQNLKGKAAESDLLFPSRRGGLRAASSLDKPFAEVRKTLGLEKTITPRAMRRTFQDLARAAEVHDVVTRAISGHATETMQRHYSTVSDAEMKQGLAKVVSLAGFKATKIEEEQGGVLGGVLGTKRNKASSR
jgi:site-specific recombinase XerC